MLWGHRLSLGMDSVQGRSGGYLQVLHTSDLHLGSESDAGLAPLERVLKAGEMVRASVFLLAGDIFDHNRVPLVVLDRVARLLADTPAQVVILPGNHDCLSRDSVYIRGGLGDPENVWILGSAGEDHVEFDDLELEIWGRAHVDYSDMAPLACPRPRSSRWQIAAAHGHFVTGPHDHHRSWLIRDDELAATEADYIALGHWDVPQKVGSDEILAYYSGSPSVAKSVNLVTFSEEGTRVQRVPLPRPVDGASDPAT